MNVSDAWTVLKSNSTLISGDTWGHLNNQNAGGTNQYIGADLRIQRSIEKLSVIRLIKTATVKIIQTPVIYKMVIRKIEVNQNGETIAIDKC